MTENIDGIFENLSPMDFNHEVTPQKLPRNETDDLALFFDTCVIGTSMTYHSMGGSLPYPTIAISDGVHIWYLPQIGGKLRTLLPWIREQMIERQATMYFFGFRTEVSSRMVSIEAPVSDSTDLESIQEAEAQDSFTDCIFFYAGRLMAAGFGRYQATAKIIGEDLGPIVIREGQSNILFDSILM